MKTTPNFLLISTLWLALLGSGCDDGMGPGKFNHQERTHRYEDYPAEQRETERKERGTVSGEMRDFWQQPDQVIKKLGDLTDKVVADIGAGPYGYFTLRLATENVKKVIAIDIEPEAITAIDNYKILIKPRIAQERVETRLVTADDPKLKPGEADVVIIVNTFYLMENRVAYLSNLKKGIAPGGRLVIVDYKIRDIPFPAPPVSMRVPLGFTEQELSAAGYRRIDSDDSTLEYQYIVTAYVE